MSMPKNFGFDEEAQMLRDTARTLLTKECTPAVVRGYMDDPSAADELWQRHLRDWVALGDGPLVDHCLFLVESGGVVLPGPYFPTSTLFLPLLRAAGEHTAEDLLPDVAIPTLVLAAERDTFTPPELAQSMADRIPGAEIMIIVGGSHAAPVEQPTAILDRIRTFLASRLAEPRAERERSAG